MHREYCLDLYMSNEYLSSAKYYFISETTGSEYSESRARAFLRPKQFDQCNLKGGCMFEYDEEIVEALLKERVDFKRKYDKYINLKQEVESANVGDAPIEDMELERMKKEKLFLKDQMASIIEDYRKENAA